MKTNQLMDIAFSHGTIKVFHKTAMGDLTDLWRVGSMFRAGEGKTSPNITQFLKSDKTKTFLAKVEKEIGQNPIQKTGRGKSAKTWANLHVMVYAAEYLSVDFHFEVIDAFINNRILSYRDESGDAFNRLNHDIDRYLPGREGKSSNQGVYIQVAKAIKAKINTGLNSWNDATAHELRCRKEIEDKLSFSLSAGLIRDYNHLKEIIEKI